MSCKSHCNLMRCSVQGELLYHNEKQSSQRTVMYGSDYKSNLEISCESQLECKQTDNLDVFTIEQQRNLKVIVVLVKLHSLFLKTCVFFTLSSYDKSIHTKITFVNTFGRKEKKKITSKTILIVSSCIKHCGYITHFS